MPGKRAKCPANSAVACARTSAGPAARTLRSRGLSWRLLLRSALHRRERDGHLRAAGAGIKVLAAEPAGRTGGQSRDLGVEGPALQFVSLIVADDRHERGNRAQLARHVDDDTLDDQDRHAAR